MLSICGGLLMLVGLTAGFRWDTRLYDSDSRTALYVLLMAVLLIVAGACGALPATKGRFGSAFLLGVSSVSTWGVVLHLSYIPSEGSDGLGLGFALLPTGHVLAAAASCLLLVRLGRRPSGTTQLVDTGRLGRLPILLGAAAAVPLGFNVRVWWGSDEPGLYLPAMWLLVLALAVPTVAAALVDAFRAVPVLVGWIAGSAILVVYYASLLREWGASFRPLVAFAVLLLAAAAVVATLALRQRGNSASRSESTEVP